MKNSLGKEKLFSKNAPVERLGCKCGTQRTFSSPVRVRLPPGNPTGTICWERETGWLLRLLSPLSTASRTKHGGREERNNAFAEWKREARWNYPPDRTKTGDRAVGQAGREGGRKEGIATVSANQSDQFPTSFAHISHDFQPTPNKFMLLWRWSRPTVHSIQFCRFSVRVNAVKTVQCENWKLQCSENCVKLHENPAKIWEKPLKISSL